MKKRWKDIAWVCLIILLLLPLFEETVRPFPKQILVKMNTDTVISNDLISRLQSVPFFSGIRCWKEQPAILTTSSNRSASVALIDFEVLHQSNSNNSDFQFLFQNDDDLQTPALILSRNAATQLYGNPDSCEDYVYLHNDLLPVMGITDKYNSFGIESSNTSAYLLNKDRDTSYQYILLDVSGYATVETACLFITRILDESGIPASVLNISSVWRLTRSLYGYIIGITAIMAGIRSGKRKRLSAVLYVAGAACVAFSFHLPTYWIPSKLLPAQIYTKLQSIILSFDQYEYPKHIIAMRPIWRVCFYILLGPLIAVLVNQICKHFISKAGIAK